MKPGEVHPHELPGHEEMVGVLEEGAELLRAVEASSEGATKSSLPLRGRVVPSGSVTCTESGLPGWISFRAAGSCFQASSCCAVGRNDT